MDFSEAFDKLADGLIGYCTDNMKFVVDSEVVKKQ